MQHLLILSDDEYKKLTASNEELEAASVENFKQEVRDYINDLNRHHALRINAVAHAFKKTYAPDKTVADFFVNIGVFLDDYDFRNAQPPLPPCLK